IHAPYPAFSLPVGGVNDVAPIPANRRVPVGTMIGRQQRTLTPILVYREQVAILAGEDDATVGHPRELSKPPSFNRGPPNSQLSRGDLLGLCGVPGGR